jgi:serine/threonine protein kinase
MDSDRWSKVKEIFSHLTEQSPSFRSNYLDMVCEDQPELRAEVEKMLRAHDQIDHHPVFTDSDNSVQLPERFGEYRVRELLGSGGMSTVYRAEHAEFGSVALKVLSAHLVSHPVATQRFQQEAALLQRIQHPALCRVFETQVYDHYALIAMEEVRGSTLEEYLRTEFVQPAQALRIAATIADVLAESHHLGVIHRDLKPANIILDDNGGARLIDFGIAKFADARLTATGEIMGSPAYMSPEQWRAEPVGSGTDVWSLGVVLYEMLCGHCPFTATSVGAAAQLILSNAPVKPLMLHGHYAPQRGASHDGMQQHSEWQHQLSSLLMQMLDKNSHTRIAPMQRVCSRLNELHDVL